MNRKKITALIIIFLPVTLLVAAGYALSISIRNLLFSKGIKKCTPSPLPSVGVGNLNMGGSGKTPHTAYLINLLSQHYDVAMLSRGYGRKTKGFVIASAVDGPETIGDEPTMLSRQFPNNTIAVCEDRVAGVELLKRCSSAPQVVILDDVFQHRHIIPTVNLLLTDYSKPFTDDCLFPLGMLREFRNGCRRADIVVVTKCPKDMTEKERDLIRKKLSPYGNYSVFFSHIEYGNPVAIDNGTTFREANNILAVTGIANPAPLIKHLEKYCKVEQLSFPDHHQFTEKDCRKIRHSFDQMDGKQKYIVTTEKDAMRLESVRQWTSGLPIFMIPIQIRFFEGNMFDNSLLALLKSRC